MESSQGTPLQALIDVIQHPVLMLSEDLHVLAANAPFYAVFHCHAEDVVGAALRRLHAGKWYDIQLFDTCTKALRQPNHTHTVTIEFDRETRQRKILLINVRAVQHNDHHSDHFSSQTALLLGIDDISERKKSDEIVQMLYKSLSDYQTAVNSIAIVSRTNAQGFIIDANEQFCKISGYSREELLGKTHRIVNSGYHPHEFFTQMWRTITSGKSWRGEVRNRKKNGEYYWVDTIITPVFDDDGTIVQYLSLRMLITEKKEAQEAMQRAKEEAEAANRAKSEFLANMSHEIRTPMNAVLGFSELLKGTVQDERQQMYVRTIISSGKTLLTIINDILDLSKIEAGKLELHAEPTDVTEVVQSVVHMFSQKSFEKRLNVNVLLEGQIPRTLLVDEVRLRQILFNLVGNAIKFTEHGFVHIVLSAVPRERVDVEEEETVELVLSVSDSGIGIPPSQQQRIFDPFAQHDSTVGRKFGGTGLGLAIVKRLVEMMNGTLTLHSTVGKGSTFTVRVPLIVIDEEQIYAITSDNNDEYSTVRFENPRILVVDDVEYNRTLVKSMLESNNVEIIEAENGKEALTAAEQFKPDIILMDLRMPVMDGYEATQILRELPATRSTPIVALTASAMTHTVEEYSGMFDGYIRKPYSTARLVAELTRFLPHTRLHDIQLPVTKEPPITLTNELSPKALAMLPELLGHLNNEVLARWKVVRDTNVIDDVEQLGAHLNVLGTRYDVPALSALGARMETQARNLEIENLPATLDSFPELLALLTKHGSTPLAPQTANLERQ